MCVLCRADRQAEVASARAVPQIWILAWARRGGSVCESMQIEVAVHRIPERVAVFVYRVRTG